MDYLELEGISDTKILTVSKIDSDQDVEIEVKNEENGEYVNVYLSVPKVKELISFLQLQIKDV